MEFPFRRYRLELVCVRASRNDTVQLDQVSANFFRERSDRPDRRDHAQLFITLDVRRRIASFSNAEAKVRERSTTRCRWRSSVMMW